MENVDLKTRFSTSLNFNKGWEFLNNLIFCFSILVLSGCVTSGKSSPLAPSPPVISSLTSAKTDIQAAYQPHYFASSSQNFIEAHMVSIESDTAGLDNELVQFDTGKIVSVNEKNRIVNALKNCRLKDRFDRKAVIAYEWGRSRLALDVDGVNLGGGGEQAVRFEYKIRFQPEKTKKQRCRYPSKWQGLVGSGYNELFVRKEDTVWTELRSIRKDALDYVRRVF